MSIYGTDLAFEPDHPDHQAPIVYQGSHVLPADTDQRGGVLGFASIDGVIGDATRAPLAPDGRDELLWPWLRISLNMEDVVIDLAQIRAIHTYLGDVIERMTDDEEQDR